eukprot:5875885-Pleurochrysis_carterae.AAC.1
MLVTMRAQACHDACSSLSRCVLKLVLAPMRQDERLLERHSIQAEALAHMRAERAHFSPREGRSQSESRSGSGSQSGSQSER